MLREVTLRAKNVES